LHEKLTQTVSAGADAALCLYRMSLQEEIARLIFSRRGLRKSFRPLIFKRRRWKQEIAAVRMKIGGPQERIQRARNNFRLLILSDGMLMKENRRT
jgi:hypothetical protein